MEKNTPFLSGYLFCLLVYIAFFCEVIQYLNILPYVNGRNIFLLTSCYCNITYLHASNKNVHCNKIENDRSIIIRWDITRSSMAAVVACWFLCGNLTLLKLLDSLHSNFSVFLQFTCVPKAKWDESLITAS